ncbi:hypothetical protein RND71_043581 [Anisodus tanguticus]|uniref:STIM1/2 Orai1-activating region domain-containing protein n=1 Tax=Anisodus tanguticus TaxID=243964 RepID=A0AAE1UN18_9SOLA|nr:hypothetical protein RND71_043581 [Anisodus tanguticus]
MEALQKAEEQLGNLQVELHQAKREQEEAKSEKIRLEENLLKEGSYPHFYLRDSSLPNVGNLNKICELEEELRLTKEHLTRLEDAMEKKQWSPPQKLQYWLQLTHELELKNHNIKRQAAEMQLLAAKEGCEKLKKKRSSFLGSFRVAHGSSIDDVDNRILQAKESLSEVTKDLQERLYRWKQIERLCNFTIQQNRGEIFLQSELYKQLISNGKKNSAITNPMQRTGSEGTLIESEDSFSLNTNQIGFSTALLKMTKSYKNIEKFDDLVKAIQEIYENDEVDIEIVKDNVAFEIEIFYKNLSLFVHIVLIIDVHHKFTETDADPHNSKRGMFFAHLGWLLTKKHPDVLIKGKGVSLDDLKNDKVVQFNRKPYNKKIQPRNNFFVNIVAMGEDLLQAVRGYTEIYKKERIFRLWLGWEPLLILWKPESVEQVMSFGQLEVDTNKLFLANLQYS